MNQISPEVFQEMFQRSAAQVIAQLLGGKQVPNQQLRALRSTQGYNDPMMQQVLAPYEHQAYAREVAAQGPVSALGQVAAVPAYAAAKKLGLTSGRSGSGDSLAQILAGFSGIGQGISQWLSPYQQNAGINPGGPAP